MRAAMPWPSSQRRHCPLQWHCIYPAAYRGWGAAPRGRCRCPAAHNPAGRVQLQARRKANLARRWAGQSDEICSGRHRLLRWLRAGEGGSSSTPHLPPRSNARRVHRAAPCLCVGRQHRTSSRGPRGPPVLLPPSARKHPAFGPFQLQPSPESRCCCRAPGWCRLWRIGR